MGRLTPGLACAPWCRPRIADGNAAVPAPRSRWNFQTQARGPATVRPPGTPLRRSGRLIALVIPIMLLAVPVQPQSIRSSVTGVVTDSSGAVLPGVAVE